MDILQETRDVHAKTFFNHVFSTTEEGKSELLNVGQYALLGVIPIVILNKSISQFIPDADGEKSSLEILFEMIKLKKQAKWLLFYNFFAKCMPKLI